MIIQNQPRPRQWHGGARPLKALKDSKSPTAKEANRLWREVQKRRAHVDATEQAAQDAVDAVQAAHLAYLAEVERCALEGKVSALDVELMAKRDRLHAEAQPSIHEPRKEAARALAEDAEKEYLRYLNAHNLDLLALLTGDAEQPPRSTSPCMRTTESGSSPSSYATPSYETPRHFCLVGMNASGLTTYQTGPPSTFPLFPLPSDSQKSGTRRRSSRRQRPAVTAPRA